MTSGGDTGLVTASSRPGSAAQRMSTPCPQASRLWSPCFQTRTVICSASRPSTSVRSTPITPARPVIVKSTSRNAPRRKPETGWPSSCVAMR